MIYAAPRSSTAMRPPLTQPERCLRGRPSVVNRSHRGRGPTTDTRSLWPKPGGAFRGRPKPGFDVDPATLNLPISPPRLTQVAFPLSSLHILCRSALIDMYRRR